MVNDGARPCWLTHACHAPTVAIEIAAVKTMDDSCAKFLRRRV